jgi:FtsP/CotA-like multicopper oxidase with cupredoxin domain
MSNKYITIAIVGAVIIAGGFLYRQTKQSGNNLPLAVSPAVVELKNGGTYNLVAGFVQKEIGSRTYRMLAYNGSIPGPLIKVMQGAEVTINFTNNTDIETTIHSHGIRLDNRFDGTPPLTQEPIKPGQSFAYKIKFPDAGMYWYHPHVREDYAQELGLYGNYFVAPKSETYWNLVNREVPLFLDDILIEDGKILLSKEGADRTLMGRFGNVMLVNGETDYRLEVKKGETIRFYVTNAANTRPFRFTIRGVRMKLVGGDGGAYEKETWTDGVTLGPSERAVIEMLFEKPGSYAIENRTPDKTYTLGNINVSDEPVDASYAAQFEKLSTHHETIASIDPLRQYFGREPDKRLALTIDLMDNMQQMMSGSGEHGSGHMMQNGQMMGGSPGGIEWEDANQMMNMMSDADTVKWKIVDQDTGKENMDIDWSFKLGEPVKIRIWNDPNSMHPMQHPIHFHGQQFLVLDRNGTKEGNLVWKDTVFIPAGEYVDILLDVSNPGDWMVHCHIAEHLEAGMMFAFKAE